MRKKMCNRIFISYAKEDFNEVEKIFLNFKRHGFDSWLDRETLLGGENWELKIKQAISEATLFLACLSEASVTKRGYVQNELDVALKISKKLPKNSTYIIPVRLNNCMLPPDLEEFHRIDLFEPDGMNKLIYTIKRHLNMNSNQMRKKEPTVSPNNISFINREDEKREIRNPGGNAQIVINAPAGYGKTRLLEEIENWYRTELRSEWICARINLNMEQYRSIPSLILNEIDTQTIGEAVNNVDADCLIDKIVDYNKHILLIFDAVESNPIAAEYLVKDFIPHLKESLSYTKLNSRFIFAGRYVKKHEWIGRNYVFINLSMLNEDIVARAVSKELEDTALSSETVDALEKEIAALSCGHPGIVCEILRSHPTGKWISLIRNGKFKSDKKFELFKKFAAPFIDNILLEIGDDNLREALKILSIFRRFELNHIRDLLGFAAFNDPPNNKRLEKIFTEIEKKKLLHKLTHLQIDESRILSQLVNTGLVSGPTREKSYWHDDIIRKLILLRIRIVDGENTFQLLNSLACAMYDSWINNEFINGESLPSSLVGKDQLDYMNESLYHLLLYLEGKNNQKNFETVVEKIKEYKQKLVSSFGYDKSWMQQSLKETIIQDDEIRVVLYKKFGKEKTKEIYEALSPES